MWLSQDSGTISPVLIEIETPTKRWFRNDGLPTQQFTQAQNQLNEWRVWFDKPANREVFRDFYKLPGGVWRQRAFEPQYVLVYGSRAEFEGRDDLTEKRFGLQRRNETYMTFDRLSPNPKAHDLLSVRITKPGEYEAVSWPAVRTLSPHLAKYRAMVANILAAIRASEWLTEERREFLVSRLPYWNDWVAGGERGIIGGERNSGE